MFLVLRSHFASQLAGTPSMIHLYSLTLSLSLFTPSILVHKDLCMCISLEHILRSEIVRSRE